MLNFSVGPVMSRTEILKVASEQTPYFRTTEFSKIMLENEEYILEFINASKDSRCVFLTSSGTGGMEACVMNLLNKEDKAIVINGGSFGQRFVELCMLHGIETVEIKCRFGQALNAAQLNEIDISGCTALLVNMHETSSGILYDMDMISSFCKMNNLLLIVDAISAFMADVVDMEKWGIAALIIGSQKALGVQPGISIVVLSKRAMELVEKNDEKCMYFSFREALKNMSRGQTPFTPAVTVLLQINVRLRQIAKDGGISKEMKLISARARYFREEIEKKSFKLVVEERKSRSNAVTAVYAKKKDAEFLFNELKDNYGIWICPNGGRHKEKVFRVGHIGELSFEDYDKLFNAMSNIYEENKK